MHKTRIYKIQMRKNPVNRVEQMYEYGYRKSNYGPDELVTDAHGNQSALWMPC